MSVFVEAGPGTRRPSVEDESSDSPSGFDEDAGAQGIDTAESERDPSADGRAGAGAGGVAGAPPPMVGAATVTTGVVMLGAGVVGVFGTPTFGGAGIVTFGGAGPVGA